jgi:hypothetical protein
MIKLPESTESWLFIGFTGSGKTTYVLEKFGGKRLIILSYAEADKAMQRFPMIDVEDLKRVLPGPRVVRVNVFRPDMNLMDILAEVAKCIHDSVVMIDDGKSEMGSNVEKPLQRALIAVRHNRNELLFTFHNINHPPPFVYDMCAHVLLWKSAFNDVRCISKVPRADEIIKAYNWVQSAEAPNYSHAHVVCNPMNPLCHKPFFKVYPKAA